MDPVSHHGYMTSFARGRAEDVDNGNNPKLWLEKKQSMIYKISRVQV